LPLFALRIGKDVVLDHPFSAEPFNAIEERLDSRMLTIGGVANQVLHWDAASVKCGRCGADNSWSSGSWGKRCQGCGHEQFPAIYPCAIVLVKRGNEFMLINKPEWSPGRYSLVAGFLDIGEALEECAVREVREETGIEVQGVKYVGSQCWPFPSQLMAGFVAEYAGGEIVVDRSEIADAQWFSREKLPDTFPPHRSIARWIIEKYALR
jgi:NAD+ diphosphatase